MTAYVRRAGAPICAISAMIVTLVCFTAEQARGESRPTRERLSRRGRSEVKCRIECHEAATARARALFEPEAFMCCEQVEMGPTVQSVIKSIPAVRLHGPSQQAGLTEPRADALRRGRDAFPTADSPGRHVS